MLQPSSVITLERHTYLLTLFFTPRPSIFTTISNKDLLANVLAKVIVVARFQQLRTSPTVFSALLYLWEMKKHGLHSNPPQSSSDKPHRS